MFAKTGAPYMGCDGKTGETLVKSALAPMFKYRDLRVLTWQGYNILGDRDGRVLADSSNKQSKVATKDGLLPSILGSMVLLFGGSFAAYATAYALTSGHIPLVPLKIGELISGNVLSDPHQAYALAFGMVIVIAIAMAIYFVLDRRASRWRRTVQ